MDEFIKGDQVAEDFKSYFSRFYEIFYDEDNDFDILCINQMLKRMFEKLDLDKNKRYEVIVSDSPILPYRDLHAVTGFDESNVTRYDMTFDKVFIRYELAYGTTYKSDDDSVDVIDIDKISKLTCIEKSTDTEIYRKYTAVDDGKNHKPLAHSIDSSDLSILAFRSVEIKPLKETNPPDECIIIKVLYNPEYIDESHMGRYSITLDHAMRMINDAKKFEDSLNSFVNSMNPFADSDKNADEITTSSGNRAAVIKLDKPPTPGDLKEIISKIIGVPMDKINGLGMMGKIPEEVEINNRKLARKAMIEEIHNFMSKCQFAPNTKLGRICKGVKNHPYCKSCAANPEHIDCAYNDLVKYLKIKAPKKTDTETGYRKFQIEKAKEWLNSEIDSTNVTYVRSGTAMSIEALTKLMLSTKLKYRYIGKNGETYTGVAHKKILTKGVVLSDMRGDIVPILDRDILVKSYRDPKSMVKWNTYPEGTFDDIACGIVPICITRYALNENSKIVKSSMTNTIVIVHVLNSVM